MKHSSTYPVSPDAVYHRDGGADKSRLVYVLLAIFLGFFGAHNFYAARIGAAVSQLVFWLAGIGAHFFFLEGHEGMARSRRMAATLWDGSLHYSYADPVYLSPLFAVGLLLTSWIVMDIFFTRRSGDGGEIC